MNTPSPAPNGKRGLDPEASKYATIVVGLRHDIRPDPGAVDKCNLEWRTHAIDAISAYHVGGSAAVERVLDAMAVDHPDIVRAIRNAPRPRKVHYTTLELLTTEFKPPEVIV